MWKYVCNALCFLLFSQYALILLIFNDLNPKRKHKNVILSPKKVTEIE